MFYEFRSALIATVCSFCLSSVSCQCHMRHVVLDAQPHRFKTNHFYSYIYINTLVFQNSNKPNLSKLNKSTLQSACPNRIKNRQVSSPYQFSHANYFFLVTSCRCHAYFVHMYKTKQQQHCFIGAMSTWLFCVPTHSSCLLEKILIYCIHQVSARPLQRNRIIT